ncbi:MAG: AMP-dependent synthetase/ligase [Cryomorphaceae bacterium]|nr:AMP-dependent synthetase/ligase [Cryomorphaceae bacterium]
MLNRLFDVPYHQLKNFPQEHMFNTKVNGEWQALSTKDFLDRSMRLSKALVHLGISSGDRVAVASTNRYEWNILDIAVQQVGAVLVPLYPTISAKDYAFILNDCSAAYMFVGNQEIADKITEVKPQLTTLKEVYAFDELNEVRSWNTLFELTHEVSELMVQERMDQVRPEDLLTIIYTSGTTGNPKGVMLSHQNVLSNVLACEEPIPADQSSKVLSFLPVCHIYERMLHYLYMYIGASIYFAESMETIGDNIREVQPDVFSAVPRLIEKVYDKIIAKGEDLTGVKKKLFFWAVGLAEEYEQTGKGSWYYLKLGIARKLIFKKWQEALGGNVRAIASGSAALQPRLSRIFLAAGIPILEGYGMTETSPVISVNSFQRGIRFGSVGALIDDVEVMIASDGEILVKGPNVMMGYYNNEDATKEVFDADGWLKTGDIGEFIEVKFLKITDRKKEIFKTSGGKYIVPQAIENSLKESRFIEQAMVIGENQKFPAAFIVPDYAFLRAWAKRHELSFEGQSNEQIIADPTVYKRIFEEVEKVNANLGNWEQLKKIKLLPDLFSIEGNELTPTLKLKRKVILEKYSQAYHEIFE